MSTVNFVVTLPTIAIWLFAIAVLLIAVTEVVKVGMQWFAFLSQKRAMEAMQQAQNAVAGQRVQPASINIPLRRRQ